MSSLRELQHAFTTAIAGEKSSPVAAAMVPDRMARRSLALYRRLIRNNYVHTLKITYPVLHQFVGDSYFRTLARGYIRRYPSTSGDLFLYGRHFSLFLLSLKAPRILVELTRLEWACHEVYQAAETPLFTKDHWESLASTDPSWVSFCLSPAARLLRCSLPIHRVWQALQPDASSEEAVDLPLAAQDTGILVVRSGGTIQVIGLGAHEYRLLEAMDDRKTVVEMEQIASECGPQRDGASFIASMLELGVLGGIEMGRQS